MKKLNRFERVAQNLELKYGVQVIWAPANREYVVEGRPAGSARTVERLARENVRQANRLIGFDPWMIHTGEE
jgi:hypothetical protein